MSDAGNMLLLADRPAGRRLKAQIDREQIVHHTDPFDALTDMSNCRWQAVVLAGPTADFAGLCRAARRLQKDASLLAVCPPQGEPEVRALLDGPLDDYFILPPTRSDLARIRQAIDGPTVAPAPGPDALALSPQQLSKLVEAARTMPALEKCLAEIVSQRLGSPVRWVDAGSAPGEARPLLLAADSVPRVLVSSAQARPGDASVETLLAALQQCVPALVATARRTGSLHRLAITDHLTGAYNRRYFYHVTDQILLRARQRAFRVTLLLYDIDDFKRYNDTYGHAAGDEILRETADLMRQTTRVHDIVARIGGDEFCVLFWDAEKPRSPDSSPLEDAYELADRFRQAVHTHKFPSLGPEAQGTLTISGGLASFPSGGQTCRELLSQADEALAAAKDSGKNSIHLVGTT